MNEKEKKEKFYLTTAIVYTSDKPHIGNTYEVIFTDAVARYKRMLGYDVYFLTGTDEHGQKIEHRAQDKGVTPQEYVDGLAGQIRDIWDLVGASYDQFIRTTNADHMRSVQKVIDKLYAQGDIYKGIYEAWYCEPCEASFTDTQVVDGKCPDCGREVKKTKKEEVYYFRASKYADRLMKYIEDHPGFIEPESRKNEMVNSFLKPGLQDLCISRTSFKWGIPFTFDENQIVYVWIDALLNYVTALGFNAGENDGELYKKYWPADVHIIGKDILRFHTIYWPIMLMALGEPLPKKVFAHPWFLFGTDKMSKSRGNTIYADDLVRHFGTDGVRHYVLAEMPYNADGSITWENVAARYNSDLANNLGNLVNRTCAMAKKYFDGVVPAPGAEDELDVSLRETVEKARDSYFKLMDSYHVADAIEEVFGALRRANKYIDETAPWVLAKNEADHGRLATVIYNLLESIRLCGVLLSPFMPGTAKSIAQQLNCSDTGFEYGALKAGVTIGESYPLFARIDEEKLFAELEAEKSADKKPAEPEKPEKPEGLAQIGIDDFMNVELRTAQVVECEPVPRAKKLLRLVLDLGYEKRQVVSGIAKYYTPDQLIGKKLIVVANLKPATLCGVESNGMILASGDDVVRVVFLDPETPNGERVH